MSIAYRSNAASAYGGGASTRAVSFSTRPTVGDLVVVVVPFYNATGTVTSVSDNQGNTYSPVTSLQMYDPPNGPWHHLYYALNVASSGTFTVTANLSAAAYVAVGVASFGGVKTSAALDATNQTRSSGINVTAGSVTPTGTCLYVNSFLTDQGAQTATAAQTQILNDDAGAAFRWGMQYSITSGALNMGWTLSGNNYWTSLVGTFDEAVAVTYFPGLGFSVQQRMG